jgi:hypothetical protein
MGIQNINLGTAPSGADGDSVRTAFGKCQNNFTDLDTRVKGSFGATLWTSNIDANATMPPGIYGSYSSGATNTPTESGILWHGASAPDGNPDTGQIWQAFSSGRLYIRQKWGGNWGPWFTVWTTGSTTVDANNFIKKA